MYRLDGFDSRSTYIAGRNGMVLGAVAGAVVFSLGTLVLDMLEVGAGGPGLAVMAGVAFGGLAGTLFGILKARNRGQTT